MNFSSDADGGKGIAYAANELCGIAIAESIKKDAGNSEAFAVSASTFA